MPLGVNRISMMEPIPLSFPLGSRWYVAEVYSKAEFKAEEALKKKGFQVYVPRLRRFRKSKFVVRQREKVDKALIPGYCFVLLDIERDEWRGIIPLSCDGRNKLLGIKHLLSQDLVPIAAERGRIEALMREESAGSFDYTIPGTNLAEGQGGEIAQGPLAGLGVKVKNARAKKRLQLVLGNGWKVRTEVFNFAKVA